jgi:ketopantoate reductase
VTQEIDIDVSGGEALVAVARNLREKGLTLYHQGEEDRRELIPVKIIDSLSEVDGVDIIAIAVKNYSLDRAAKSVKEQVKGNPVVIGLQNGIETRVFCPNISTASFTASLSLTPGLMSPALSAIRMSLRGASSAVS